MWEINIYTLMVQLLPIVKRSVSVCAYLWCAFKQIEVLYNELITFRIANKKAMQYTSQVLSIEKKIQEDTNSSMIWIEEAPLPSEVVIYMFEDADDELIVYSAEDVEVGVVLFSAEEYESEPDFIVHAPEYVSIIEAKIRKIIDEYKYPDKNYKLLFDNQVIPQRNYY